MTGIQYLRLHLIPAQNDSVGDRFTVRVWFWIKTIYIITYVNDYLPLLLRYHDYLR